MSAGHHHHAHPHSAAGESHGSVKSYVIGFLLSVVLTIIPFALVMQGGLAKDTLAMIVIGFALVQVVVQLVFFLHMNGSSAQRWNVMAFAFTLLVIAILVSGSVWIMINLRYFMMPH
jgi:cytochrome o ubiquinol oxidase operon protein cyoD